MVTNESQETLEQSGWTFQSEEIPDAPTGGGGGGLVLPLLFTTNSDNEPTSFTLDADNPTLQPLLDALATAEVGAKLPASVTLYNPDTLSTISSVETTFAYLLEYEGAKMCLVQFSFRFADGNENRENVWAILGALSIAEGQVAFQAEEPVKLGGNELVLHINHDDIDDTLTLNNVSEAKEILTQLRFEWNYAHKPKLIIRSDASNANVHFDLPIVRIDKPSSSVLEVRGAFPDVNLSGGADAQDELFSQSPFGILIRATWSGAISVANCTIEQFPLYPVFG